MISANSFGQFMQMMAADTIKYLGGMALKKAAFEFAEGWAALGQTWGVPNPSSTAHFTAAAAFAALGMGGMAIGSAVGGAGGGGSAGGLSPGDGKQFSIGGSSSTNYRDSSISSSRESERRSAPTVVQNIYIKGRSDLLTKKDVQTIGKRLSEGRL